MTIGNGTVSILLGDEYDDTLKEVLRTVLVEMGAVRVAGEWGVGGSQELETLLVEVRGERVTVEAETFVGLSITGSEEVVGEIDRRVKGLLEGG